MQQQQDLSMPLTNGKQCCAAPLAQTDAKGSLSDQDLRTFVTAGKAARLASPEAWDGVVAMRYGAILRRVQQ